MKIDCYRSGMPTNEMNFRLTAEDENDVRVIEELRHFGGGEISVGTAEPIIPSSSPVYYKEWHASITLRCNR